MPCGELQNIYKKLSNEAMHSVTKEIYMRDATQEYIYNVILVFFFAMEAFYQ